MTTKFLPGVEQLFTGKSYEYKYKDLEKKLGSFQNANQAWLMHALEASQKGYGNADAAITQQGALGTKALLDREKQGLAGNQQNMISRGLYSTTATDANNRAITNDTNQGLNELESQLALMRSNVAIGKGQAEAAGYGALAQSNQNYEQLLLSLGLNTEYGKQGGIGNAVLSLIGGLFGSGGSQSTKTGKT